MCLAITFVRAWSFKLNGETLRQEPNIEGQTATLNLGNLPKGTHTITYDSVMNPGVSVGDKVWINELDGSKTMPPGHGAKTKNTRGTAKA